MKIFLVFPVLMSFLAGCSPPEPSAPGKNHLIYIIADAPASLDPAATQDLVYYQIAFNIFETLITVNWKTGVFEPALATRWQSDSPQLNWTFVLRRGVRFHDGSPLHAEAVKISFERQFVAGSPYYRRKITDVFGPLAFAMIQEIRALNDSTVQFILKYPHAAFLDNLASPYYATIVSPAALETHQENFGRHPIGTGPFAFVRWDSTGKIVIKKFPQYWRQPAQLDSVIYKVVHSLDKKINDLRRGEADVISGLNAASVDQFYRDASFKMVEELSLATVILGMKFRNPPFDARRVRQAVAHAIDKKYIVANVSRNLAIPAKGPLSPLLAFYDSTLTAPEYDTVRAKTLLPKNGDDGRASVKLGYCVDTDSERGNPMAQAIKHDLQKAGLPISVQPYSNWPSYEANVLAGNDCELFLWGNLSFTRHSGDFFYALFHSRSPGNFFNYKNSAVDKLLEQARRAPDREQQRRLYRRAQEIILWETPAVFISHPKTVYATRAWVKKFSTDPLGIPSLKEVELENRSQK